MKLTEELLRLAQGARTEDQAILQAAIELLENRHLWRQAWLNAERRVDLLTGELSMLRLSGPNRKKKEESND